jgi:hypothetical protein
MAIGGTIGGILGAAIGTGVAGPAGTTIGASIGSGLGQLVEGGVQKKKSKAMSPSPVSPMDQALFNTLRRRQQRIATGTEYNPQITAGREMAKSLKNASFNAGGPVNQGLYSNLMSQTMRNITEMSARDAIQANQQLMEQGTRMADISMDLQRAKQVKEEADAAQNQKAGFQNLSAALMPKGEYKEPSIPKDDSDPYAFLKTLYAENEELKKKQKELEEKAKANQGTTGGTSDNTTGGSN